MASGCIIVESLRVGTLLEVGGLRMTRLSRQDVSSGATPAQPTVWTLVNFEADDAVANELAEALARVAVGRRRLVRRFPRGRRPCDRVR